MQGPWVAVVGGLLGDEMRVHAIPHDYGGHVGVRWTEVARARLEHLIFLGYCNDYHQYFPTIEASTEGGYGTEVPVAMVEYGAGERIMDRALIHLYQMRGLVLR